MRTVSPAITDTEVPRRCEHDPGCVVNHSVNCFEKNGLRQEQVDDFLTAPMSRQALLEALADPGVHHPDNCDCDLDGARCEGIESQADRVLAMLASRSAS